MHEMRKHPMIGFKLLNDMNQLTMNRELSPFSIMKGLTAPVIPRGFGNMKFTSTDGYAPLPMYTMH